AAAAGAGVFGGGADPAVSRVVRRAAPPLRAARGDRRADRTGAGAKPCLRARRDARAGRPPRRPGNRPPAGTDALPRRRDARRRGEGRAVLGALSLRLAGRRGALKHVPVLRDVGLPLRRRVFLGKDRGDRALGLARAAVDALVGVDVELVLGVAPIATWLTAGRELPWWSAAVMEWLVLGGAIVLLAVAVARLGGATVERAAAWCRRTALAPRPAVFGAFLALVAFTLALWFAFYCYGGRFFSSDEMAQRLQANLLLQGRFFARLDAPPEFFSAPGVVITPAGRLYSQFPIGGPAAIALGVAIGAPWVINPLLTGLTALGVYRFAAAVYGEPIGRASGVLFALSPFVLFVGASQMNHVLTLAGVVLAL